MCVTERFVCVCVCVVKQFSLGFRLRLKSTEVNFIAAQFQAFVFPPATTPDTRAPVAPNFLFVSSCCHHLFLCVRVHVYVCPCHHKSHSPLTCRLSGRNWHHILRNQFLWFTRLHLYNTPPPYLSLCYWIPLSPCRSCLSSLPVFAVTLFHSPPPFPSLSWCLWFFSLPSRCLYN